LGTLHVEGVVDDPDQTGDGLERPSRIIMNPANEIQPAAQALP
jgi:hypothetical protein